MLFTNGTARTPQQYVEMLRAVDFSLPGNRVLTPASCAADLFRRRGYKRVLALDCEGLEKSLFEAGMQTVKPEDRPKMDAVLVAWFREFTMSALESACHAAWNGARVYSCWQSLYFANAHGKALGTSRAISAMIKDLTGARIEVVGKPALEVPLSAARQLGVRTKELTVVGDDPSVEGPMALRGGALAVAVNTGIASAESFAHLHPGRRPHIAVHDVGELLSLYKGH